jgi:hypothetical protein
MTNAIATGKSIQYHFVVRWDESSNAWGVDPETLDAKFDAEIAWDELSNTWLSYRSDDELREKFTEREDALASLLQSYNLTN